MFDVGLDIHSTRISVCVLSETGAGRTPRPSPRHRGGDPCPQWPARPLRGLLRGELRRIEQELNRQARRSPVVARLRIIPGVGARTAEAVAAFVDDPHLFRKAKAVGRYFGLVPCQDQSGDRNRLGHITREGAPVVRQLVAEAAWQAQRRSPTVRAYFERAQRGDPQRKKIALVATAHYLVRVMWALLKRGTLWEEKVPVDRSPEIVSAEMET